MGFSSPGTYHLQFYAAQRYSNQHFLQLRLQLDGVNVGSVIQPTSTSYAMYSSPAFTLSSMGWHTVALLGVNPYNDDNTILIDAITLVSP